MMFPFRSLHMPSRNPQQGDDNSEPLPTLPALHCYCWVGGVYVHSPPWQGFSIPPPAQSLKCSSPETKEKALSHMMTWIFGACPLCRKKALYQQSQENRKKHAHTNSNPSPSSEPKREHTHPSSHHVGDTTGGPPRGAGGVFSRRFCSFLGTNT